MFLALLAAAAAAALCFVAVPAAIRAQSAVTTVLRPVADLKAGTVITEEALTEVSVGTTGLADGVLTDAADVIGMVAAVDLDARCPLYADQFLTADAYEAANGVSVPEGTSLVSLSLPDGAAGGAGFLTAGETADVFVTRTVTAADGSSTLETESPALLQGLTVYEVSDAQMRPCAESGGVPSVVTFVADAAQQVLLIALEHDPACEIHLTVQKEVRSR